MIELTGKYDYMLPLLVSCFVAYGIAEAMNNVRFRGVAGTHETARGGSGKRLKRTDRGCSSVACTNAPRLTVGRVNQEAPRIRLGYRCQVAIQRSSSWPARRPVAKVLAEATVRQLEAERQPENGLLFRFLVASEPVARPPSPLAREGKCRFAPDHLPGGEVLEARRNYGFVNSASLHS